MFANPLNNTNFNLDSSGVAGFFGGEEALSAMGTVHLYRGQKWLGWYNSPGSYTVAKQYGKLANNRFWDALFPGGNIEPAKFFGLDGNPGPQFIAGRSGTRLKVTGHIAHIFMKIAKKPDPIEVPPNNPSDKRSRPSIVVVADLTTVKTLSPELLRKASLAAAFATMFSSIVPCIICGVFDDWYCFSMILLGIISNGLSCFVIGSGELKFQNPQSSPNSPPGDGILIDGSDVIILRGVEATVGAVTMGNFNLTYCGEPERRAIGVCSLFQYAQFLAQLLLIPQGTLFGQVMFLATFVASWMYNCYLSSFDKVDLQSELVKGTLANPNIQSFKLRTRTTMVVFALLILNPSNPEVLLNRLLPNDTQTWVTWKKNVLHQISLGKKFYFDTSDLQEIDGGHLLKDLYYDAETAYDAYRRYIIGKHTPPTRSRATLEV